MASSTQTVESIRITVEDLASHQKAGDPVTVLDARSPKAWDASATKIPGAIRIPPDRFQIDPAWSKERLTVVY